MHTLSETIRVLFCVFLGCSIVYSFVELVLATLFGRRVKRSSNHPFNVTVLRPLSGATDETASCLESLLHQTFPPAEIRYGVDSEDDPVILMLQKLHARFPRIPMRVEVEQNIGAPNRKIAKLERLSSGCQTPIVLAIDQDIDLPPDHLAEVLSHFSDPSVGLVTSLYRIGKPKTPGSVLELLAIHADFFPSVLVAKQLFGGLSFAFGATMAFKREALQKIGGFKSVENYLADDYELGKRIRSAGYHVVLSDSVVEHVPGNLTFKEYVERQVRAARTHRVCRPAGYALSLLMQGFPWALGLLLFPGSPQWAWKLISLWIAGRVAQVIVCDKTLTGKFGFMTWLAFLPIHETARFVFWITAFCGNTVKWGTRFFRVNPSGRMAAIGED